MPRRKAAKPLVDDRFIRVRADGRRNKLTTRVGRIAHDKVGHVGNIRLASAEEIGPRLTQQVLGPVGEDECQNGRKQKAQKAGMELPHLMTPGVPPGAFLVGSFQSH